MSFASPTRRIERFRFQREMSGTEPSGGMITSVHPAAIARLDSNDTWTACHRMQSVRELTQSPHLGVWRPTPTP